MPLCVPPDLVQSIASQFTRGSIESLLVHDESINKPSSLLESGDQGFSKRHRGVLEGQRLPNSAAFVLPSLF